jgi:hypothetical protein
MDSLSLRGGTLATTAAVLTATGAETVFDHGIVTFSIDGKQYIKAAVVDGVTPTTDANTGLAFPALVGGASVANTPGHGCVVVWGYNAAGTIKCAMGPHASLDMQGNFLWDAPQFPAIPADFCPFAYQVLKAGATASATAIVFGTANWNATGFTNVIQLVSWLPSRPKVA